MSPRSNRRRRLVGQITVNDAEGRNVTSSVDFRVPEDLHETAVLMLVVIN